MLVKLSDKMHLVITGYTIKDTQFKKTISGSVVTKVYFKKLSKREIDNYVASEDLMDKAGAYAIQEKGALFVKKIEGDFFNIVGLPLYDIVQALQKFKITVL